MLIGLVGYEANIPNRVGSNEYAYELLKALHRQDQENQYLVYLPSLPLKDMPEEKENWRYQVVGPPKLWNFFGLPHFLFQQKPKPDLVFNPGHYCPLFSPVPVVVAIMDLGFLHAPQQFTKLIYWKLKFWTSWSIKRAKHIFAISQATKNDIIKEYGLARSRVTVTYPGFDKKNFHPRIRKTEIERVKRKYGLKKEYLLFTSTLKPSKNIESLIEAYSLLSSQDSDLQLVIAGRKGWLYKPIYDWVDQLGLKKKVVFTGFVPKADLPGLVAGAQVFVMPSFWEGFGLVVVEAMACGVPVMVSNRGSLPEVVGRAGIVVDPEKPADISQGIKKALKNKENLIEKGLIQVKKFNWDNCAQQTLEVLEKVGGNEDV